MKKILLLIVALLVTAGQFLLAQDNTTGTVVYEELMKIEIKLEGEMAHLMKDMPKERRSEKVLYFSPEASLYQNIEKEDNADHAMMEGGVRIMMSTPDNKLFLDLAKKELIEQKEFMTRTFLVNGDLPSSEWKITGEQKMILDHPCMEATKTDTAGVVTRLWFAPTIPVKSGPSVFCNLPGLVLEVDIEDGKQKFVAQSIDFEQPGKDKFKKPKHGKKVSKEEFEKIVEEKMKEMGAEGGVRSGSHVMIKIKH